MPRYFSIAFCLSYLGICAITVSAQDERLAGKSGILTYQVNSKIDNPDSADHSSSESRYQFRISWNDWGSRMAFYSTLGSEQSEVLRLTTVRNGAETFHIFRKKPGMPWLVGDTIGKGETDTTTQLFVQGNVSLPGVTEPLRREDGWIQYGTDAVLGRECTMWKRKIDKDPKGTTRKERVCLWRGLCLRKEEVLTKEKQAWSWSTNWVASQVELDREVPPESFELPRDIPIEDLSKIQERAKAFHEKILKAPNPKSALKELYHDEAKKVPSNSVPSNE